MEMVATRKEASIHREAGSREEAYYVQASARTEMWALDGILKAEFPASGSCPYLIVQYCENNIYSECTTG